MIFFRYIVEGTFRVGFQVQKQVSDLPLDTSVGPVGVPANLHLSPAPATFQRRVTMWHFLMQGDVSKFADGSSVKVHVASINKNNCKDLAGVPLSSLCLPYSPCSEHGPDSAQG